MNSKCKCADSKSSHLSYYSHIIQKRKKKYNPSWARIPEKSTRRREIQGKQGIGQRKRVHHECPGRNYRNVTWTPSCLRRLVANSRSSRTSSMVHEDDAKSPIVSLLNIGNPSSDSNKSNSELSLLLLLLMGKWFLKCSHFSRRVSGWELDAAFWTILSQYGAKSWMLSVESVGWWMFSHVFIEFGAPSK